VTQAAPFAAHQSRIRRYPTFIIEKKTVYSGWDRKKIEEMLDTHIQAANRRQTGR
jgi:hypothetical protein